MRVLTINNGGLIMDGGFVHLRGTDAAGRPWQVLLDWSIAAQKAGITGLSIDGTKVQAGRSEEAEWIESLRCAEIARIDDSVSSPLAGQTSLILAEDAKAYIEAAQKGPRSALMTLRDDLLKKIQSPQHKQRLTDSRAS
jgi:hypothetical protein